MGGAASTKKKTSSQTVSVREKGAASNDEYDQLVKRVRNLGEEFQSYATALEEKERVLDLACLVSIQQVDLAYLFMLVPKEHEQSLQDAMQLTAVPKTSPSFTLTVVTPPSSSKYSKMTSRMPSSKNSSKFTSVKHVVSPAESGTSASEVMEKVSTLGKQYQSYATALREQQSLDGEFLCRLKEKEILMYIFVPKEHETKMKQKVFDSVEAICKYSLLPIPTDVQEWVNGLIKRVDKETRKEKARSAMTWLKMALLHAHNDKRLKQAIIDLLGTSYFTKNLRHFQFYDELKKHATRHGKMLGQKMKEYYDAENLKEQLGPVECRLHQGREWKTQEHFIKPRAAPLHTVGGVFESEAVYIHVLRMVALAIDADFQQYCTNLASEHNGQLRGVPIKGVTRMWNKMQSRTDHRFLSQDLLDANMTKRCAQNIDINRNAITFQTVADMKGFIAAAETAFDGVARFKNMFAFDAARAKSQLYYRTFMINVVWPPVEGDYCRTFRELALKHKSTWTDYSETMPQDITFSGSRWRLQCKQAILLLEQLAQDDAAFKFICETQLLLQPYLEGRMHTHLMYKIARSESDAALHSDFKTNDNVKGAGQSFEAIEDTALQEVVVAMKEGGDKNMLLLRHCWEGHAKASIALVNAGANIEIGDESGAIAGELSKNSTSLQLAALNGHISVVDALVKKGAKVGHKYSEKHGYFPMYNATNNGHVQVVSILLEAGADKDCRKNADGTGSTCLICACQNGNMDVAEIILNKKPDIEAKNSHGQSALSVAVTYGHADVVRILLSHGAQVDAMHGSTGQTALIVAVQKGFLDVVEVLLDHGAEIDKKNKVQDSALSVAVMRKNPPMVKLILTRGADSAGLLQDAKNMGEVGKIDAHTLAMLRASDAFIFDPNSRFSSGVLKPPIGIS